MPQSTFNALLILAWTTLLTFSAATLSAEIYRVVDENGRVTYTDTPPENRRAEKVQLKEPNTVPPAVITNRGPAPETTEEESEAPADYRLQITYPPDEFHVNPGMRNLNVQVAVEPQPDPAYRLQIVDNGQVIPGTTLDNIVVRGPHVLQARLVDPQGRIVSQSDPVKIFVHRPTVRNRQ